MTTLKPSPYIVRKKAFVWSLRRVPSKEERVLKLPSPSVRANKNMKTAKEIFVKIY